MLPSSIDIVYIYASQKSFTNTILTQPWTLTLQTILTHYSNSYSLMSQVIWMVWVKSWISMCKRDDNSANSRANSFISLWLWPLHLLNHVCKCIFSSSIIVNQISENSKFTGYPNSKMGGAEHSLWWKTLQFLIKIWWINDL